MGAIEALCQHVTRTSYPDLPPTAVTAAKTFVLDTLGVGIAGSSGPKAAALAAATATWGQGQKARVWSTGERLPAPAAALCNAYQAHNSEFDCIHEAAVAHVMTVVLPGALAGAERLGGIDGRRLIEAVAVGVDVAVNLGLAANEGLRFFRPATVGAFGGTAALGKVMGLDAEQMHHAFSIAYGQLCGTMQAHTEGSMLLALQMGFNARNAVTACDLAALGVEGPRDILEGEFGYFRLFEHDGSAARAVADLGRAWRITEVAHKPFPSGRATHGLIDACLELQRRHGFEAAEVERVVARVTPLVHQLVGRPSKPQMAINYARLCAAYVAARAMVKGSLDITDFTDGAYADAATQDLARRIAVEAVEGGSFNAFTPIDVAVTLKDGTRHDLQLEVVYGNPARPMTREAHLAKFGRNAELGTKPLPQAKIEQAIALVDRLEDVEDVTALVDQVVG
jgi:aconitate decarboxylase